MSDACTRRFAYGAARSHDRAQVPDGARVRQAEHAAQPERDRSDSAARLPSPGFGCFASPLTFGGA